MPELPEVETVRRSLEPRLLGATITGGAIGHPKLVQNLSPQEFIYRVRGHQIEALRRRGKYLLIDLSGGFTVTIHLRMTGQLTVEPGQTPPDKATHLRLTLGDGNELRFRDQRKFGRVAFLAPGEESPSLRKLGPEPLEPEFTVKKFRDCLAGHKLAIKKALLNQEIIAGIGNIYADESLFRAGIHPARPVDELNHAELKRLHGAIRSVLAEGIACRGTSVRDYCDGDGRPGSYQERLQVYGRKGRPCMVCGTALVKTSLGGRGTHFCPKCQPIPGERGDRG